MLTIRQAQVESLDQAAIQRFEDQVVEHLKEFDPRQSALLGEADVHKVVRLGIEQAKQYGFTNRGPVRFYIEMMFTLGSYFDTDPQFHWAATVLNDAQTSDQMARALRLHHQAMDYLEKALGPEGEYAIAAARQMGSTGLESLSKSDAPFNERVTASLQVVNPQKCQYLGQDGVRSMIRAGAKLAEIYSVSSEPDVALFILLVFALGHHFDEDPLFPWATLTLNDPAVSDPNKRAEHLRTSMVAYFREWGEWPQQRKGDG